MAIHILALSDALQVIIALNVDHVVRIASTITLLLVAHGCHLYLLEHLVVVTGQDLSRGILLRHTNATLARATSKLALVQSTVEVVKCDDDRGYVVAAAAHGTRFQNRIDRQACQLVSPFVLRLGLLRVANCLLIHRVDERLRPSLLHEARLPDQVNTVPILQLVKYTIAADDDEVMPSPINLERRHVGVSHHYPLIAI